MSNKREAKLWKIIGNAHNCKDAATYWKTLKRMRNKVTEYFPGYIIHQGNHITNKNKIMEHVNEYYNQLSIGTDEEALIFKKYTEKMDVLIKHGKIKKDLEDAIRNINKRNKVPQPQPHNNANRDFTLEELYKMIGKSKCGKTTGPDEQPPEFLKHAPESFVTHLLNFFQACFDLGYTPAEMQNCYTKLLYKKGENTDIKNYRPITLLNTIFKIWERMLETRLRAHFEGQDLMSVLQNGSRRGKSTAETVLAYNIIMEAHSDSTTYTAQVDLSKAYNRVKRTQLWKTLDDNGINGKLWNSIVSTYEPHTDTIQIGAHKSEPNFLSDGLRQGSVLSPLLFIIYINPLINKLQKSKHGVHMPGMGTHENVACIMFVDDLTLISKTPEGLTALLNIVLNYALENDTVINIHKSTIHSTNPDEDMEALCENSTLPLKSRPTYTHLGVVNDPRNKSNKEHLDHRINKANGILHSMINRGLSTKKLEENVCLNILDTVIIPTLTYAMEALDLTVREYEKLDQFAINALNHIHKTQRTSAPSTWALYEYGMKPPSVLVKRAKLNLFMKNICGKTATSKSESNILGKAIKAFPNNFLSTDIEQMLSETSKKLHNKIYEKHMIFTKYGIKKETDDFMRNMDEQHLKQTLPKKWTQFEPPTEIPDVVNTTHGIRTRREARALYLYGKNPVECLKCDKSKATIFHNIMECTSPLHTLAREKLKIQLKRMDEDLHDFLYEQDQRSQILFILGLKTIPQRPSDFFTSLYITHFLKQQEIYLL